MTTALGEEPPEEPSLRLLGVDVETGELEVDVEVFAPQAWQPGHPENSYASPTPVASAGRLWVHFGTYGTAAFDTEALRSGSTEPLWRAHNTPQEHEVGPGSSPILVQGAAAGGEDLLVVHADATDTQALVALDPATGDVIWRTDRFVPKDEQAYHSVAHHKAFSTPLYYVYDGTPLLLSTSAAHTSAYAPATGRELWRVRHTGYSNVPMPVAGLGFAWINTGYMKPQLLAVRLGAERMLGDAEGPLDITQDRVLWSYHWQVPSNPTPLLVHRRLFLISDWGIATWLDALAGTEIWRQRLGGRYFASPLTAEGRIYVWNVQGETKVLAASDEFEELATNPLDAPIRATPAIACGAIFLRTTEALYRIQSPG
ncbi:MAG: PQQ-binding-like beta-propeller repeat protein [Thermoanaerobaculia bacterium]|nr:PQQ-binding-like beta-propeller repeat protein [Thermoanaerobaculia bacterium]